MLRTASEKMSERINRKALSCFLTSIMLLMILPVFAGDKEKDEDTLRQANLVLQGFLNSNNISLTSLSKANCVLILPNVKKFGFGIGGSGGRGPLLCRSGQNFDGKWSTPAMYSVGGMSAGFQVGGSSTDFVLLLMTPKVVNQILNGKTKMGTDATAAAGPRRTAASASDAEIPTYWETRGPVCCGIPRSGTIGPDNDANHRLYGKTLTATNIVRETGVQPTTEGKSLVAVLDSKIAKHRN